MGDAHYDREAPAREGDGRLHKLEAERMEHEWACLKSEVEHLRRSRDAWAMEALDADEGHWRQRCSQLVTLFLDPKLLPEERRTRMGLAIEAIAKELEVR